MGIKFKDLKVGHYYKGYHQPAPAGRKVFFYVTAIGYTGGRAVMDSWTYLRGSTGTWRPAGSQSGAPDDETLLKTAITTLDVTNESAPLCHAPTSPTTWAVSTGIPQVVPRTTVLPVPPKPPSLEQAKRSTETTSDESSHRARAERNKGKAAIPENAHSLTCTKCGKSNRSLYLLQFTTYWCPACEPE